MKKKRARLKRTRRLPSPHLSHEQVVARRRSEKRNTSQGAPRKGRVERETEAKAGKKEGNTLHRHLNEKRNTGRIRRLREKTLALRRTMLVQRARMLLQSTEILVQNNMKI